MAAVVEAEGGVPREIVEAQTRRLCRGLAEVEQDACAERAVDDAEGPVGETSRGAAVSAAKVGERQFNG